MFRHRRRYRRGLALMIVLSLLVLFLLMGVSYLLVARQSEKGAHAMGKSELRGDDPRHLADTVIYQLVRDTNDRSSLLGHSLLEDLYGNDGATGTLSNVETTAGPTYQQTDGQFMLLQSTNISRPWLTELSGTSAQVPDFPNYFNGRVITMVTGSAKGISSRVVDSRIVTVSNQPRYQLRVEAFEADGGPVVPSAGDRFIINGAPFNGSGAGYRINPISNAPLVDNTDATYNLEIALSPHYIALNANTLQARALANLGGADESHDAVDYQNMFLAMVPAGSTSGSEIIPSFHRPSLINYWYDQWQQAKSPPMPNFRPALQGMSEIDFVRLVAQKFSLRPLPFLHPNFTGSNSQLTFLSAFDINDQMQRDIVSAWLRQDEAALSNLLGVPTKIQWDVDNDNDGVPDSIWVDVGLPVVTSPGGRRVKPLVAILVKDLDGRLNLNANSSLAQASGNYTNISSSMLQPGVAAFAGGGAATSPATVPRGRGYGPADIYFAHVLDAGNRATEFNDLLRARYSNDGLPGIQNTNDMLSRIKALRFPALYEQVPPAQPLTCYASPPDIWGFDGFALNFTGHPFAIARGLPDPTTDEPYELNLSDDASDDTGVLDGSFKLAELERLLRYPDLDSAALASRLLTNAPGSFDGFNRTAHTRRNLVTTESRHIPVANTQLAPEQRGLTYKSEAAAQLGLQGPNIADLLQAKLTRASFSGDVNFQIELQLPFEVRHGQLFNLNRLFGNGADDNGNLIVDDPNETVQNLDPNNPNNRLPAFEFIWKNLGLPTDFDDARFNYSNNQVRVPSNRYAKQMYARHLYCLMMLLIDNGKNPLGSVPPASYLKDAFLEAGLNDDQKKELMARRVAQWAINVVDFRDSDALMTPFEYDVDPLNDNGWDLNIDGDPGTNEYDPSSPRRAPDRRIVWGCEYPDLLITEVKAFHDRRVADTNVENVGNPKKRKDGNQVGDDDVDQYRIPQGSLFMELYCPRNRLERSASEVYNKAPLELYTSNGTAPFLDLGRMAPAALPNTAPNRGAHPVWRVAISSSHLNGVSGLDTFSRSSSNPDSVSFQPEDMSLLPPHLHNPSTGPNQVNLERFVWFANVNPVAAGVSNPELIYWNRLAAVPPLLRAGSYAVVGPRVTTHVGSQVQPAADLAGGMKPMYLPSTQKIVLNNSTAEGVRYFKLGNNTANPDSPVLARAQKALPIIAAANFPAAWDNTDLVTADLGLGVANINQVGVGISVSEPLTNTYYQQPTETIFATGPKDSWFNADNAPDPATNALPDRPFDELGNSPLSQLPNRELNKTHTRENYRTAFLQRLADPTIPWNPGPGEPGHNANYPVNPYLTVDWSPIDLTIFSGEMRNGTFMAGGNTYWIDDADPDPLDPMGRREKFDTREKGKDKTGPATPQDVNIWTQNVTTPQNTPVNGAGSDYFSVDLINSLGFLNKTYGIARDGSMAGADYRGDPSMPWPWLSWNSRPFDTPLELMNVPATPISRLLHEFRLPVVAGNPDPYNSSGTPPVKQASFLAPFSHLLNFFHTSVPAGEYLSPHFYRIFDVVETPSPFVGTEKWYDPKPFGLTVAPGPDGVWGKPASGSFNGDDDLDGVVNNFSEAGWPDSDDIGAPLNSFRPPYNYLSRFRDPGRINVNTIFDQAVFEGLMKGFPAMDPSVNATVWPNFLRSRQGYVGGGLNQNFPTRFAQPFRSATSGDIAPLPNLRQAGIDATLLRRDPNNTSRPLFDFDTSGQQYNDTLRNAGFRYAGLQRLSNLVTTHSNVYAVWITIGYFEVEPPIPALSPDHQLGPEIGSDTGDVKRHRAFYIVDRSIPVAYEPGENHNVDRCIRLRRFIE